MGGRSSFLHSTSWLLAICLAAGGSASAQVLFSTNFESGIPGAFSASGALTSLTTTSLPTDGAGISSPNQSSWLGALGQGIAKNANASGEVVTLTLTGTTPGTTYSVTFDLLIGGSWDGAAVTYGPDEWRLRADGTILVDTIFSDSNGAGNMGAYSPPRYSDTTFTNPNGPDQPYFSGADFHFVSGSTNYSGDYAIYYFGHGTGNPVLTFTATGTTATLEFARLLTASGDSGDEYWALDNVSVSVIPEPAETGLWFAGLATVAGWRRRRSAAIPT